jgi:hypothetical protein
MYSPQLAAFSTLLIRPKAATTTDKRPLENVSPAELAGRRSPRLLKSYWENIKLS